MTNSVNFNCFSSNIPSSLEEKHEDLMHAISRDDERTALFLIQELTPEELILLNELGYTPLHFASICKQPKVVHALVAKLPPEAYYMQEQNDNTPLSFATRHACFEICRLIVHHSPPGTFLLKNKDGYIPLHIAICRDLMNKEDKQVLVSLLIHRSPESCSTVDNHNNTPLHLAAAWCDLGTLLLVMKNPAQLTSQNKKGDTPLHSAILAWR